MRIAASTLLLLLCLQEAKPVKLPLPGAIRDGLWFSPDGAWLYYNEAVDKPDGFSEFSNFMALFRTSVDGKKTDKIVDVGLDTYWLQFLPDGKRLIVVRHCEDQNKDKTIDYNDGTGLWLCNLDGSKGSYVVKPGDFKVSIQGVLSDGRFIVCYRKDYAQTDGRLALRDETGKEEELGTGHSFQVIDDSNAWLSAIEKDTNHDGKIDYEDDQVWYRYSIKEKKRKDELGDLQVSLPPISAGGCLWYAKRIDSDGDGKFTYKDRAVLVIRDLEIGGRREVDLETLSILPRAAAGDGVLCWAWMENAAEICIITKDGKRRTLWASETPLRDPAISPDGKCVAVWLIRDTKGDGRYYQWENEGDLYTKALK